MLDSVDNVDSFIEGAIQNLLRLADNLRALGYRFASDSGPVALVSGGLNAELEVLRGRVSPLPLLFDRWYSTVKYLDFSQDASQLLEPSSEAVAGLGLNCTLLFSDLSDLLETKTHVEENGFVCTGAHGEEFIPFGSYASNSTPKGIWIPGGSVDPVIYDAGLGPITMSEEIAKAIACGGFPFWDKMFSRRRFTSPIPNTPRFKEIYSRLQEGIMPLT